MLEKNVCFPPAVIPTSPPPPSPVYTSWQERGRGEGGHLLILVVASVNFPSPHRREPVPRRREDKRGEVCWKSGIAG